MGEAEAGSPALSGSSDAAWSARYPAVGLVAYDSSWVVRYEELAASLRAGLGPGWNIEHVGSTSIPGLCAKPVIDLALGEPHDHDLSSLSATFRALGWTEPIVLGDHQAVFMLSGTVRVAICHIFSDEQWETAHVRLFADWLRSHDDERDAYQRLKSGLVTDGVWGSEYTRSKAEFVLRVVNLARSSRQLPPVRVL